MCRRTKKKAGHLLLPNILENEGLVGGCGGFFFCEDGRGRLGGEEEWGDNVGRRSSIVFFIRWRSCDGGRVVGGLAVVSLMALRVHPGMKEGLGTAGALPGEQQHPSFPLS